ncbi:MAG: hypothetical protein ACPGEC_04080 [Flavobacteriales bacterium]
MLFAKNNGKFELFSIDIETLEYKTTTGKVPSSFDLKDLKILNNTAYITGSELVILVDLETGILKKLKIILENYRPYLNQVKDIQIINDVNEALIYFQVELGFENEYYIVRLDEHGNQKGQIKLKREKDKHIVSATSTCIGKGGYLVTGTYSHKKNNLSTGVFISKITNNKTNFIKFYNFLEFDYFATHLPFREQRKIKRKKARKEKKGKELERSYLIDIHNIVERNNQYFFLGEVYHATTRPTTAFGPNGQSYTTYVFDGYQYTNAVLASFDKSGNKQWDESFYMYPDYKPFKPKKFVTHSFTDDNQIKLVYSGRESISAQTFDFYGNTIDLLFFKDIDTGDGEDQTRTQTKAMMDYWYGNYFIAHGTAKIRNKNSTEKRKVYFINKISYN